MKKESVLTNEFYIFFDEKEESIFIHTIHNGSKDDPIRVRLETLKGMSPEDASKWFGERILLLIPEVRKTIFLIENDGC
ncbi:MULTISPECIES: hypothetical protein [Xanthomonas]|uniref:Uncharacterized protein n=1 Tax=Xanthomonas campestris pv. phaseoli TaxID=317013 RepID=A0A7Z7NJ77_XANCH|nr:MULTISPECIES: hypothetical protein [Xanthomonas]QOY22226.1 hypothetical protein FYK61_13000 [Xanthomonas citri]QQK68374.1 hypothetical protein G3566_12975 [Xanthomonas citri]QTD87942.1 hypothetical protein XcfCFBP6988P_23640 [Xanthomonas citri pv. phaseoli var. fuscans]QTF14029.1 hypothetical protein XcfCFBP6989P_23550 [Xanthomonas citri pv. phaseoli var. fuscans]QTF14251.1 hypothetical protein XcfCFBP6991P_24300 [Xanthomonas citri pv. phaseoli var. fuscans]